MLERIYNRVRYIGRKGELKEAIKEFKKEY